MQEVRLMKRVLRNTTGARVTSLERELGAPHSVYVHPGILDSLGYSQSFWSPEGQSFPRLKGVIREILKQSGMRRLRELRRCQHPASSWVVGTAVIKKCKRQKQGD